MLIDLRDVDAARFDALVELTFAAAQTHKSTWLPTLRDAREELDDALAPARIARVLVDDAGAPLGWVGLMPLWGRVWELHPLIVGVDHHRRGHGRLLVEEAERLAAEKGALTLWVGTSDEGGATSLGGIDLYDDPIAALASFELRASHAAGFWLAVGYRLVGVVPDAEGPGKPSLCLAKRLASR